MLKNALRDAARVYRTNWKEGALAVLLQLLLRLMALAPLLFLCARETRFLALVCLPLYVLLVLPVRQLTAQCMQSALSGGPLLQVPTMQSYGRALAQGLKRTGLMLLWAAPWLCATGFAVRVYSGNVDVFTLLRTLMSLGGGSSIQGVKIVLLIYAATLVPVLAGCAFHSGTRHAEALGGRRMLKGDDKPGFYIKHFLKDMRIAIESAQEAGMELPGLKKAKELYDQLAERGMEDKGTQAIIQWYQG